MKLVVKGFVAIGMLFLLSGCMKYQQPVRLKISSDGCLNTSDSAESLPVILKVYELSDDTAFAKASFEELWKRDAQVLGNSVKGKYEYTILPDQIERFDFKKKNETQMIGFVATFRNPEKSSWKKVIKVPSGFRPRAIRLCLKDNQLS